MHKLRSYFIGLFLILLAACSNRIEDQSNLSYISERGSYYAYNDLNQLEITDSVKKKFSIEFVEKNGTAEIVHFRHVNTFRFYKIVANSNRQVSPWVIGQIDYQYSIIETLLTEDSLTIASTYEAIYDKRENINGGSVLLADHAGTIEIQIKSPDQKEISKKILTSNGIWVNGSSFISINDIQWIPSDNDVHGEKTAIFTRNTLELKQLVHGKNQVLVEYWDDF